MSAPEGVSALGGVCSWGGCLLLRGCLLPGVCVCSRGVSGRHPPEAELSIQLMSGRYASYWNAFLSCHGYSVYFIGLQDCNSPFLGSGPEWTLAVKGAWVIVTARKSLGQGNIFTSVYQEFCSRGGGVPGGDPPGTATAAGGTHPTGMHSCLKLKSVGNPGFARWGRQNFLKTA